MNHYPRHIGDYLKDTSHLSLLEHGVYTRLLDVYYTREAPIPAEQAERLVGARTREEKAALQAVLCEFFTPSSEGWRQARADRELERYREKAERNRQIGKLGGRPKTQKEPRNNPDGFQKQTQTEPTDNPSHKPIANSHKPDKTSPSSGAKPDPVKQEIWTVGRSMLTGEGMSEDRAGSYLGKLVKDYGQVLVLDAVRDAVKTTPAKPSEWLQARCQERRKPQSKQAALEARNAAVAAAWTPPED